MFSGGGKDGAKDGFLEQARQAREERQKHKGKEKAAICLQKYARGFVCRQRFGRDIRAVVDDLLQLPKEEEEYKPTVTKPATEVMAVLRKFTFVYDFSVDRRRSECVCKYLLASAESDEPRRNYLTLAVQRNTLLTWLAQVKALCWMSCQALTQLKPELQSDLRTATTNLAFLLTMTACDKWRVIKGQEGLRKGMTQLCANIMGHLNNKGLYNTLQKFLTRGLARAKLAFTQMTLTALITLALRPVQAANYSGSLLTSFALHVLSVPALVMHLAQLATATRDLLVTERVFTKIIELLGDEQNAKIVFNSLQGNYALCLLANLMELGYVEIEGLVDYLPAFQRVACELLQQCGVYVRTKQSAATHWHPILGWFSQRTDQGLHDSLPHVQRQLQQMWSPRVLRLVFVDVLSHAEEQRAKEEGASSDKRGKEKEKNIFKRAFQRVNSSKSSATRVKLDSPLVKSTCAAATLYTAAMATLQQCRMDILAGVSCQGEVLPALWGFLWHVSGQGNPRVFLDLLTSDVKSSHPVFNVLTLFCDAASHLVTIVDDVELYEKHVPFHPSELAAMSSLLNNLLFRLVQGHLVDLQQLSTSSLFSSLHRLLNILYSRDCRRKFCPEGHWLIKELKPATFIAELDRNTKAATVILQKMPHVIPFKDRVQLFRRYVATEKEALGLSESASVVPAMTPVTIHRSRLLEDGYQQIAALPTNAVKGIIRVKFINEQGLDEVGIDQFGVFKEFLEESIKRVFDPALNLFKTTSEQKLYPSPTSHIQEHHLHLFHFVGRMLAKAVYEGIVVDVPFAPFFVTHLLGNLGASYSSIDELPSLDPDLYKNLTFMKHYEGDVADLDLTFSSDEDVMGKLTTHELIPGGKYATVNNSNRISYVHLMAHFRMYVQIREQTAAFVRGFKSVVPTDWLSMFSAPELQKLISGDARDLDLEDFRKHVQYYGGFHNNHKVINWLFDVLRKDFSHEERGLFLKFVTSCSKPPLLGFVHLEPPFSIRCVEVSEDQDTGDTLGTVIRGFFNVGRREKEGRLPTASTCFNLLKLPNYKSRQTLRDKLRYSIHSNTGFELS